MRVGLLVSPGFDVMSFAPLATFEIANRVAKQRPYEVRLLSDEGGRIASSLGMEVETERAGDMSLDTVLLGAPSEVASPTPEIKAFLQGAVASCRRIVSIGVSAFTLADSGVLDGRRATTHWAFTRELQARYPKVAVEDDRLFVVDGPIWTSAGMAAGVDLALGLIERDLGGDIARETARTMVVQERRPGGQSQHSPLLELSVKSDRVQNALLFARANLKSDLSVERLADAARLSPRQFSRVFRAETGQSPAKAVESLRREAAWLMLDLSRLSIEEIAEATGFGDRERMRRSFRRAFRKAPQELRSASRPAAMI